ncbi:MAG: hypothetical protein ACE5G7_04900 [Candidatus Hydrothermarchaeaceae archaeon]
MKNAILAGLIGTILGMIFGTLTGTFGAWEPILGVGGASGSVGFWVVGLVVGTAVSLAYPYALAARLPGGSGVVKGVVFGLVVWIVVDIVSLAVPAMNDAAYASPVAVTLILTAIMHVIWGGAVGYVNEKKFIA